LITMSPNGIVGHDGEKWTLVSGDVTVTRGREVVEL
jgi:hypothetical protein